VTDSITLTLNEAQVELSPREMSELYTLANSPGWDILKKILEVLERGTRRELENGTTPLDNIRHLQGRLSVATDLRDLLDDGVPRWIAAMRKDKD